MLTNEMTGLLQEYEVAGEFTFKSRLQRAFMVNLKFYFVIVVLAVGIIVWTIIHFGLSITQVQSLPCRFSLLLSPRITSSHLVSSLPFSPLIPSSLPFSYNLFPSLLLYRLLFPSLITSSLLSSCTLQLSGSLISLSNTYGLLLVIALLVRR